uniref:VUT family protein n=1 Tax=Heterorhabditis bacteriophora TaxID=37862 RepID=A0A1I7WGP9_HETBA
MVNKRKMHPNPLCFYIIGTIIDLIN